MSKTDETAAPISTMMKPQAESKEPNYQAWVRTGIEEALAEDIAEPGARISQREMWKKHDLEP